MPTITIFFMNVLVWSTTWYAINFQKGIVPLEVSVAYRFLIAGVLLLAWVVARKEFKRIPLRLHGLLMVQGSVMFCINYWLSYHAATYIPSGLNALLHSCVILFTILNSMIFFKAKPTVSVAIGALFGVTGLVFVFYPEVSQMGFKEQELRGVFFALSASYVASLGNMVSSYFSRHAFKVTFTNGLSMMYASLLGFLACVVMGKPLALPMDPVYLGSLFYLAVLGSIIAFGFYVTLIARWGPSKASYVGILVPVVALFISQFFENYHWTWQAVVGVILVLSGNVLALMRKPIAKRATDA